MNTCAHEPPETRANTHTLSHTSMLRCRTPRDYEGKTHTHTHTQKAEGNWRIWLLRKILYVPRSARVGATG